MIVRFEKRYALPLAEVFAYFRTPADWARLYGFAGAVEERAGGWTAVPLHRFPFPLVARNVELEPERFVRWVFRGFWKGGGEVRFAGDERRVELAGEERISVRALGPLSIVVEKLLLEKGFHAVWEHGWRRLAKAEAARQAAEKGAS